MDHDYEYFDLDGINGAETVVDFGDAAAQWNGYEYSFPMWMDYDLNPNNGWNPVYVGQIS